MTAYYNEHDPKKAAWLRELIAAGVIAPGIVDERSIEDVLPAEARALRLRGYGDAIVAPLAMEFIQAAMEWGKR